MSTMNGVQLHQHQPKVFKRENNQNLKNKLKNGIEVKEKKREESKEAEVLSTPRRNHSASLNNHPHGSSHKMVGPTPTRRKIISSTPDLVRSRPRTAPPANGNGSVSQSHKNKKSNLPMKGSSNMMAPTLSQTQKVVRREPPNSARKADERKKIPKATGQGAGGLTKAKSPNLSTKARSAINHNNHQANNYNLLTSAERELLEIKQGREEAIKKLKESQKSFSLFKLNANISNSSLISQGPIVKKQIQLTQPVSPKFRVSQRALLHKPLVTNEPKEKEKKNILTSSYSGGCTITKPIPFDLHTADRVKPSLFIPSEEAQIQLINSMPKFKALPLNQKIFTAGGEIGVPKVEKKPLTAPQEFVFNVDQRALKYEHKVPEEENKAELFKARPIPLTLYEPEVIPPVPSLPALTPDECVPFALATEARGMVKEAEYQQKLANQEEQEKIKRNFVAQPILLVSQPLNSHLQLNKHTQPQPFNLQTELMASNDKNHDENQPPNVEFHALPLNKKILEAPTFTASLPHRMIPLGDITLQSNIRATIRKEFDEKIVKKMTEQQELEKEQQRLKEENDKITIANLRSKLIHKPLPLPVETLNQPDFVPKTSQQPLTDPKSPNLLTSRRASSLHNNNNLPTTTIRTSAIKMR